MDLHLAALRRAALPQIFLLFLCGLAFAQIAPPAIPTTPAGHTLQTWLDTFNSGDRARFEQYVMTVDKSETVDGLAAFHDQTGGFDLLSIESSEPLHIRFMVKEHGGDTHALGNLIVHDGIPPTVATFGLSAIPAGVTVPNVTLDAILRKKVVAEVDSSLDTWYMDAPLGKKMIAALDAQLNSGSYDTITDGDTFADRLTHDLRAVSHDRHLNVSFNPFKMPERKPPTPDEIVRQNRSILRDNCAFRKIEVLPDNIGYIRFDAFLPPEPCGPVVVSAMAFVSHASALIFDLRENHGGDPAMVTLIASYLFDKLTHLNDLYTRKDDVTHQYWTLSYVPGERMPKIPIYVLTSKNTFSGGEEFTYDLKTQKRATVVGETTGGGAHPVSGHTIADYFTIGVPDANAINPITHTNWEGTGVEPDVKVPAADALAKAQDLAKKALEAKPADQAAAQPSRSSAP